MGQTTVVQPTTQAVVEVEPIVTIVVKELVTLELAIAPIDVGPTTVSLGRRQPWPKETFPLPKNESSDCPGGKDITISFNNVLFSF